VHRDSTLQSLENNKPLTDDALDFALLFSVHVANRLGRNWNVGKLTLRFTTRVREIPREKIRNPNLKDITEKEFLRFEDQVGDEVSVVIVPFCIYGHYTFALLFPKQTTVLYVDPYGSASDELTAAAVDCYARIRAAAKTPPPLPLTRWTRMSSTVRYQKKDDKVNCGVFCAMIVRVIAARNPGALLHFSSVAEEETGIGEYVQSYRKTIADAVRSLSPKERRKTIAPKYVDLLDSKEQRLFAFDEVSSLLQPHLDAEVFLRTGRVPQGNLLGAVPFPERRTLAHVLVEVYMGGEERQIHKSSDLVRRATRTVDV
jgi:hypothetical protein